MRILCALTAARPGRWPIWRAETVVKVTGNGRGGRNQELALAAAAGIAGLDAAVFSVGSDGTDGPTDAAGGYADGDTLVALRAAGLDPFAVLNNNDSTRRSKPWAVCFLPARPEQM